MMMIMGDNTYSYYLPSIRNRKSYNNNKLHNQKRRILMAIEKGKCVLRSTLNNPKYEWTTEQRSMMEKCLLLREKKYLIDPSQIIHINDKRFRKALHLKEIIDIDKNRLISIEEKLNNFEYQLSQSNSTTSKEDILKEVLNFKKLLSDLHPNSNRISRQASKKKETDLPLAFNKSTSSNYPLYSDTFRTKFKRKMEGIPVDPNSLYNAFIIAMRRNKTVKSIPSTPSALRKLLIDNIKNIIHVEGSTNTRNVLTKNVSSRISEGAHGKEEELNLLSQYFDVCIAIWDGDAKDWTFSLNTKRECHDKMIYFHKTGSYYTLLVPREFKKPKTDNMNVEPRRPTVQQEIPPDVIRNTREIEEYEPPIQNNMDMSPSNEGRLHKNVAKVRKRNPSPNVSSPPHKPTLNNIIDFQAQNSKLESFTNMELDLSKNDQNSTSNRTITEESIIQIWNWFIDNDIFYKNKSDLSKSKGKESKKREINKLFVDLQSFDLFHLKWNTTNLFDVYRYPNRYYKLLRLKKPYLNVLYTLFSQSRLSQSNTLHLPTEQQLPEHYKSIISIRDLIHNVANIRNFEQMYTVIQSHSKEVEEYKIQNEPYFEWKDIEDVVENMEKKYMKKVTNTNLLLLLRDLIILRIYVHENVVRDNLGLLKLTDYNDQKDNYIVMNNQTKQYTLFLNDYKNNIIRGKYDFSLSLKTSEYIKEYIDKFNSTFQNVQLNYLFTKLGDDPGEPYKDGKLASVISSIFKKHGEIRGLGINQLRHSVATHYKDAHDTIKVDLAMKMQHSLEQHKKYERFSNKIIPIPGLEKYKNHTFSLNNKDPYHNTIVEVMQQNQRHGFIKYVSFQAIVKNKNERNRNKNSIQYDIFIDPECNGTFCKQFKRTTTTIPKKENNSSKTYFTESEVESLINYKDEQRRLLFELTPKFTQDYKDIRLKKTKINIEPLSRDVVFRPFVLEKTEHTFQFHDGSKYHFFIKSHKNVDKEFIDMEFMGKIYRNVYYDEYSQNDERLPFKLVLNTIKPEILESLEYAMNNNECKLKSNKIFDRKSNRCKTKPDWTKTKKQSIEIKNTRINEFKMKDLQELTMTFNFNPLMKHSNIVLI